MGCRTCTNYSNKLNYCSYINDYLSIFDDLDKGCEVYENCKEPSAQEMFEKLGYKRNDWNEFIISYTRNKLNKSQNSTIEFDTNWKIIRTQSTQYGDIKSKQITIEQLKAINQQCRELGWL